MGIKKFLLTLAVILGSLVLHAQSEFSRHTVQQGETVYSIAKNYNLSESELLKYNPDIAKKLRVGDILIIPKKSAYENGTTTHTAQPKETLYGLAKQYNCTVEEIEALNPELKNGLKVGMLIKIPSKKDPLTEPEDHSQFEYHTVAEKETVYSLCRMADISEEEFLKHNTQVIQSGLQIGMRVKWPKTQTTRTPAQLPKQETKSASGYATYRIKVGDDLQKIASQFGMIEDDLIKLNPELANEILPGRFILVKPTSKPDLHSISAEQKNAFWRPVASNENIHLTVLLPFFLGEEDSLGIKVNEKAKMALQFWAGFQIAADTLIKSGYNITIDVFDTQNSSDRLDHLVKKINPNTDIIIGPLYAKNAQEVAKAIPDKWVVSPLSKTLNNNLHPNLINSAANNEAEFKAIARYINKQKRPVNVVFWNLDTIPSKINVEKVQQLVQNPKASIQEVWIKQGSKNQPKISDYVQTEKLNLFVLVDNDLAFLSANMNYMRGTKDTNTVLIGTSKLLELKTIETRYMNSINFRSFDSDFIDYSDTATQQFIIKFRQSTQTDPNKFGFYGYDAALYFIQLAAEKKGKSDIVWPVIQGLCQGFQFNKSGNGAINNEYMHTLRIKDMMLQKAD